MHRFTARPAFTLLEMIIAITVFTIFIGLVIASYLSFHRADQEALATRALILEVEAAMNTLSEAVRENRVDYSVTTEPGVLRLVNVDGTEYFIFRWDPEAERLSLEKVDAEGRPLDGYLSPIFLHGENTRVSFVDFEIFPEKDPYDPAHAAETEVQYQPLVRMSLTFAVPGRVREEVSFRLQSSVSSRFYQ